MAAKIKLFLWRIEYVKIKPPIQIQMKADQISIHISGYTGFVGSNLKTYLSQERFHPIPMHLRHTNTILFPPTKAVIHLAGKAHDLQKVNCPEEYYQVNTELTKKIFDAFLLSDAEVFITLSSVKAVADAVKDILTEDVIPNPQTHYGKSKLLAEEYILSKFLPKEKRVYILRPCMIHGMGNKGNLNLLYDVISKRIPWPLAAFNNQRSFLSIDNLCFVIHELIKRQDIPSGIYQIADDEPLSTNQLIELISKALNFKPKLWRVPQSIVTGISKIGDILKLPLNTERLQKLTENYIVSNQKIKKALEKNLPLSASEGILKTVASLKKQQP